MSEVKIPKEQILKMIEADLNEKLKAVSEATHTPMKVDNIEWTLEGITIRLETN